MNTEQLQARLVHLQAAGVVYGVMAQGIAADDFDLPRIDPRFRASYQVRNGLFMMAEERSYLIMEIHRRQDHGDWPGPDSQLVKV